MKIKIGGQTWQRRLVNRLGPEGDPYDGDCCYDSHELRIVRGQTDRNELNSDIHEFTHAALPAMREWFVTQFADDLTVFLHDKLGYRKTK